MLLYDAQVNLAIFPALPKAGPDAATFLLKKRTSWTDNLDF